MMYTGSIMGTYKGITICTIGLKTKSMKYHEHYYIMNILIIEYKFDILCSSQILGGSGDKNVTQIYMSAINL